MNQVSKRKRRPCNAVLPRCSERMVFGFVENQRQYVWRLILGILAMVAVPIWVLRFTSNADDLANYGERTSYSAFPIRLRNARSSRHIVVSPNDGIRTCMPVEPRLTPRRRK